MRCVSSEPFEFADASVHPDGAVTLGFTFTSSTAISASPAVTPAGLGITRLLTVALAANDDEPKVTVPPPSAVTVHVNVSVAAIVAPLLSLTRTVTAYGLPAAAVPEIVPEMSPVAVSIDNPEGRPVAEYVSGSLSGSVACAEREIRAPCASERFGRSWSNVGSWSGAGAPPEAGRRTMS